MRSIFKGIKLDFESVVINSTILLLVIFAFLIEVIGYFRFTKTFTKEYNDSAYRTALTAAAIINANNIDLYLESKGNNVEYNLTNDRLNILTNKQDVSVIYVIKPDNDYKHFTSIFNSVSDDSGYIPWKIGYRVKTSHKNYEKYYKKIMNGSLERATVIRKRNLDGGLPHITSLIPIKDSTGNVKAILCVQRFMKELSTARKQYLISVSMLTVLVIIIIVFLSSKYIKKHITKPILTITKEAEKFSLDNKKSNKLNKNISKISEISSLAVSVDKMEIDIINYIDNITKSAKEKERITTELKLASSIQSNSLPTNFDEFASIKEFNLYAMMHPAKEVGGDFYDFFMIDDSHLGIVIADVSGKGIPAALFMMVTKILINENARNIADPGKVLSVVNDRICNNNKSNMFITVWLGVLNLKTGVLEFANAGHEDYAIYDGNTFKIDKYKHGVPIGVIDNYEYKTLSIKLNKGSKLFIYTDGVVETMNDKEQMYGINRMIASLNKISKNDVRKMLEYMKSDLDKYSKGTTQFDDVTMLALEYRGDVDEKKV